MKRFVLKALIFSTILVLIGYSLQIFIDKSIKSSQRLHFQVWNDIFDSKISSDLIILGSSRAKSQFSPNIIDSALNLQSCNLGMDGTGFNLQYCRFKLLVKYNRFPKYIIQNVDCYSTLQNNIFQFEQYLPYLNDTIIRRATYQCQLFDQKDFFIPLYKYTHSLFTKQIILDGVNCLFNGTHGTGALDNFKANYSSWDSSFDSFKKINSKGIKIKYDSSSIRLFNEFLFFCKKEKINVILVYAPEYIGLQKLILNRDSLVKVYRNFATKYDFTFLDYSNDSICQNKNYFFNSEHLNINGVKLFNTKLTRDLKSFIIKTNI